MKLVAGAAHLSWMAGLLLGAASAAQAGETLTYGYDELGRLVKVVRSGTVNNGRSECYAYDAAGNRSNVTVASGAVCTASGGGGGGTVSFSIASNGPVTEGPGVSSVFTVTKTGTASGSLTVNYATANGTATASGDYTTKSGTLNFATADISKTVSVPITNDSVAESAETFSMNLSAPSGGAVIGTGSATATINDDDGGGGGSGPCSGATFSIASNVAVTEGANAIFSVTKSGSTTASCYVDYATANGSAIAGSDYTAKAGTLTFAVSTSSQPVSVSTIDDSAVESAETFTLNLSLFPGEGTLGTASATATINDNDSGGGGGNQPPVAVNDNGGTQATCSSELYYVLSNDSDPDGDPLTITSVTGIGFSIQGSAIQYAALRSTGTKSGTYTISDGHGGTASATLTVVVFDDGCNTLMAPIGEEPVDAVPGEGSETPPDEPPAEGR